MKNTLPTLFVCHGDDGGPPFHPCSIVQKALHGAGIAYTKVIAGRGSPFPFLRPGRPELLRETGTEKLPTMKLADGTVLIHDDIQRWIKRGGMGSPPPACMEA